MYYVKANGGSDKNNDKSESNAFRTIQKAADLSILQGFLHWLFRGN
jgi:hypothetical protein